MGETKLCREVCIFDKGLLPVTAETIIRFRGLCKNQPGEQPCEWYDTQYERLVR